MKNKVSILMGSKSDLDVMNKACDILREFGINYEMKILSAHRTPHETIDYIESSESDVFIAGAGGAAHLPGVIAGITAKPVIGVPVNASISIQGIDSLLSIVQMPPGVPVATVGIDNAKNAGILAAQIIGVSNSEIFNKIVEFKKNQHDAVLASNNALTAH
jgi:5-(carboxyamino)imidazole ribonucleotide mutase